MMEKRGISFLLHENNYILERKLKLGFYLFATIVEVEGVKMGQ